MSYPTVLTRHGGPTRLHLPTPLCLSSTTPLYSSPLSVGYFLSVRLSLFQPSHCRSSVPLFWDSRLSPYPTPPTHDDLGDETTMGHGPSGPQFRGVFRSSPLEEEEGGGGREGRREKKNRKKILFY